MATPCELDDDAQQGTLGIAAAGDSTKVEEESNNHELEWP